MDVAELLAALESLIAANPDWETRHMEADRLLLAFIDDERITRLFAEMGKYYA